MNDNTMTTQFDESDQPGQSIEEIMQIIAEATVPPAGTQNLNHYLTGETTQNINFSISCLF
jgi:serine/threonine-protein kinase SRK2